jgi:hypothetical protein
MMIGGIKFPYDSTRDVSTHGPIVGFVLRCHPLALWIPGMLIGLVAGLLR